MTSFPCEITKYGLNSINIFYFVDFPLNCLKIITELSKLKREFKIITELSKLKREFSLMWSEVEEEAKWKKMVSQSGILVRWELSVLLLNIHFIPRIIVHIIELKVEKMQNCVYFFGVYISSSFTRKTHTIMNQCLFLCLLHYSVR